MRLTRIGTHHNDNLPRQVRDIVNVELGFRREAFVDEMPMVILFVGRNTQAVLAL